MFHLYIFFITCLFLFQCSIDKSSKFSFYELEEKILQPIEKKWFTPKVLKKMNSPIIFHQGTSIWYHYELDWDHEIEYIVSLFIKELIWREVEFKNKRVKPKRKFLMDKFQSLKPGEYLLRVSNSKKVIDQIKFSIFSDHNENNSIWNYDSSIIELY